jgi:hypothetical protein
MVVDCPLDWDAYLGAACLSYRIKSHSALNISPYELLYGRAPPHMVPDILLQLGRSRGLERMATTVDLRDAAHEMEIQITNARNDHQESSGGIKDSLQVGDHVLVVNIPKKHKLDTNYQRMVYTVVGCFENGSYQLVDSSGVPLKRRRNIGTLRKLYQD